MKKYLDLIIVFVAELALLAAFCFCVFAIFNTMALYKDQYETAGDIEAGKSLTICLLVYKILSVIFGLLIFIFPYFWFKYKSRYIKH